MSLPSKLPASGCSSACTTSSASTAPFTNSFSIGNISSHSVPSVLVTVTKLLAKNTPLTNENLYSSFANGDFSALSLVAKSALPFISNLFTMNFMVAGLGVDSVYTLILILISYLNSINKFRQDFYLIYHSKLL